METIHNALWPLMSTGLVGIMSDSYWLKPNSRRPTYTKRNGSASGKTNPPGAKKKQKGSWGILHGYSWRCVCYKACRTFHWIPSIEIHRTIRRWIHAEEILLRHMACLNPGMFWRDRCIWLMIYCINQVFAISILLTQLINSINIKNLIDRIFYQRYL